MSFQYEHEVMYYETDKMGITHHSNYIRWMEEARTAFLKEIGWDYRKLEEEGIVCPVISVECQYRKTTTFEDRIVIDLVISEFKGVKLFFSYQMRNEKGELVFTGRSGHAFLGKDGTILRVKKEYPEFYETISAMVESEG